MGPSRLVTALLAIVSLPALVGAQVRVGAEVGYSMLDRKDTSLSHGPLEDEVTLGRTWLIGGVVDVRFTEHDSLAFEFVYGPYANDVDRYCIYSFSSNACQPVVGQSVSRALLYGMQYVRSFGGASWRPFVAGGFGVKRYWYGDDYVQSTATSPALSVAVGAETARRIPVRLELRTVFVDSHPLRQGAHEVELQARLTVLFSGH
jgi:hypothetical protein